MRNEKHKIMKDLPQRTKPAPTWEKNTRMLIAFFLILFGIFAVTLIKPVFDVVVVGFLFSFILYLPINALSKKFRGRFILAESIIFFLVALLFAFLILSFLRNIVADTQDLSQALLSINTTSLVNILPTQGNIASQLQQVTASVATGLIKILGELVNGVVTLFTGLFIGFLLMMNMHGGRGIMVSWVPESMSGEIKSLLTSMDHMWVRYMLVQVIYASCIAGASYLLFLILGVPYPLPMAIVIGVLSVIPIIGGILGSIVIAFNCLIFGSTRFTSMPPAMFALIVLVLELLISQGIYFFIGLPLTGKMVKLPMVVVLVGAMIGFSTGSILVAFLAVPLISTAKVIGSYLLVKVMNLDRPAVEPVEDKGDPGFFNQLMIPKEPGYR
jgi:predicted PurR-regulated permease PerM